MLLTVCYRDGGFRDQIPIAEEAPSRRGDEQSLADK